MHSVENLFPDILLKFNKLWLNNGRIIRILQTSPVDPDNVSVATGDFEIKDTFVLHSSTYVTTDSIKTVLYNSI